MPVKKVLAKAKAKATVNTNIKINIGNTDKKNKKRKAVRRKATVVQNIPLQTSPTIYNPAPTPFYVTSPNTPPPMTYANVVAQDLKRDEKTKIATTVQQPQIIDITPQMGQPSGSMVDSPALEQFSNLEIPMNINNVIEDFFYTSPPPIKKKTRKQLLIEQANRLGIKVLTSDTIKRLEEKINKNKLE